LLQDTAGGRILLCVVCMFFYGKEVPDNPADVIIHGWSLCQRHSVCAIGNSDPSDFDELLMNASRLDGGPLTPTAPA
jgi:hypothetical protein